MSARHHYLPRILMIGAATATVVAAPAAVAETAAPRNGWRHHHFEGWAARWCFSPRQTLQL
jgi:hypothetical protein